LQLCRIRPTDGQRRDVVQRGLNGHERIGEATLAGCGSMAQSRELFQRNHVSLAERPDRRASERGHMAEALEFASNIAGERPHIGALAALGLEHGVVPIWHIDQIESVYLDRALLELNHLAVTREVVGALAVNLERREPRRYLLDHASEARQQGTDRVGI